MQQAPSTSGQQQAEIGLDELAWHGGRRMGRHLLNNVTENWTFTYIIIAFTATFGAVLLGVIALTLYCCWGGRRSKVHPGAAQAGVPEYTPYKAAAGQAPGAQALDSHGQMQPDLRQMQGDPEVLAAAGQLQPDERQHQPGPPGGAHGGPQSAGGAPDPYAAPLPAGLPPMDRRGATVPLESVAAAGPLAPQPYEAVRAGVPPALMAAVQAPALFRPYISNARPIGAPPYERLLLISSRVNQPMKAVEAVQPNVAVVVYDWYNSTLQDIVRLIKRTIGLNKVYSLAMIAPGDTPGRISVLHNSETYPEVLQQKGELLQFWRVLASCVRPSGINDGRRVDLLGCRLVESPREGAALLKELWMRTAVPFAAADDAAAGFQLATFLEEPNSGALSLIGSPIRGLDLYFKREVLLDWQVVAPAAAPMLNPAVPPPVPVPQAPAQPSVPTLTPPPVQPASDKAPQPVPLQPPSPLQQTPPPPQQPTVQQLNTGAVQTGDIFERFVAAVEAKGLDLNYVFDQHDTDRNGQLTYEQVAKLVLTMVPDASTKDLQHFIAMMDLDGNSLISLEEFKATLEQNRGIHNRLRVSEVDSELLQILHDYLTDNLDILKEYFRMTDADSSGTLDHAEVARFVNDIPGELTTEDKKYLIGYLYNADKNSDGVLTLDELQQVLSSFKSAATVTVAKYQGGVDPYAQQAAPG